MTEDPRPLHVLRGINTLKRVVELLNSLHSVGQEKWHQNCQIDSGTNYEPDLELWLNFQHYGVEVKGVNVSWTRYYDATQHIGRMSMRKNQWTHLKKWCKKHNAEPLVIVELKTKAKRVPFLYYVLDTNAMGIIAKFSNPQASWFNVNIFEIIKYGKPLEDVDP